MKANALDIEEAAKNMKSIFVEKNSNQLDYQKFIDQFMN
jgi:hypothetical protein